MSHTLPLTAWHNGQLVPHRSLSVSLQDLGIRQSVIAVERLRTYGHQVAQLEAHIVRWRRTLDELYLPIAVDSESLRWRIESLMDANRAWLSEVGDCGIVMMATPGEAAPAPAVTTPFGNEWMHLQAIQHSIVERHRAAGQRLFITDVEQPSDRCWPRDIKVRCRLHYYLADQQAREHHPDAVGLLVDHDGTVTETSNSNIAIVRQGEVWAPPVEQVLPGVTMEAVRQACEELGLVWHDERLWPAEIREAEEVWLMGTDGGLWFASHIDGAAKTVDGPPDLFRRVLPQFDQIVRQ